MPSIPKVREPFKVPGSKNYYIEFQRKRMSTRTADKAKAWEYYRDFLRLIEAKEREQLDHKTRAYMTVFQFRKQYMDWAKVERPRNTYLADRQALNRLSDLHAQVPLAEIGQWHVDQVVTTMLKAGLKVSSVNNFLRHVKSAFSKAVAWGILDDNPLGKVKLRRQDKAPPKALSIQQVGALLKTLAGDCYMELVIRAFLITGRSRAELAGLRSLQDLLGHTQYSTTEIYSSFSPDHLAREAERVTLDLE